MFFWVCDFFFSRFTLNKECTVAWVNDDDNFILFCRVATESMRYVIYQEIKIFHVVPLLSLLHSNPL